MRKLRWIAILCLIVLLVPMAEVSAAVVVKAPVMESVEYDVAREGLEVTWSEVVGAAGYQVYRATSKSGKYSKVATVTENSYRDDFVDFSKTYYYKVRAYKKLDGEITYSKYSKVMEQTVNGDVKSLDFGTLIGQASAARKALIASKTSFSKIHDYLVVEKDLLTKKELNALKESRPLADSLTQKQALADVDLYFRTLKYAYGAYHWFGEKSFAKAEKAVIAKVKKEENLTGGRLGQILKEEMKFVRDGHFFVHTSESYLDDKAVRYEYLYSDQYFSKDSKGYYQEIKGTKWYYASCTDSKAEIAPTLLESGEIVYGLMMFCPLAETDMEDTITLKNGSKTKKVNVTWTEQTSYKDKYFNGMDFTFAEYDGLSYVSLRSFQGGPAQQKDFETFMQTGTEMRDSKLIIFDIRSNTGGSDHYAHEWFYNYTGQPVEMKQAFTIKNTALRYNEWGYAEPGKENITYSITDGKFVANKTPIIVLVDDRCLSAGESMLNVLKTLDNVIVVGSNSSGWQLCGNWDAFVLPNSGVGFGIPISLGFNTELKNVDGIGYEPDIWCDPQDMLPTVLNMIEVNGLASSEQVNGLAESIETNAPANLTIKYKDYDMHVGEGFGYEDFNETVQVQVDGKTITNYKISINDPTAGTAKMDKNGNLLLKAKKRGQWELIIEYQGRNYVFGWATW